MPAAVPALVITGSSSTESTSGSTLAAGYRRASSSAFRQCVVQRRRLPGDHGEVVGRQAVVGPVDAEDLADGAELEWEEAVDDHDGDVTQHGHPPGRRLSGYWPS